MTAINRFGVVAINAARARHMAIDTTADLETADQVGVAAQNNGSGSPSISTGDVPMANATGVYGYLAASGAKPSIDTPSGAGSDATNGIYAENFGSGSTVVITGDVTAGSGSNYHHERRRGRGRYRRGDPRTRLSRLDHYQ